MLVLFQIVPFQPAIASKPPTKQQSQRQRKQIPIVIGRSRKPIISDAGCADQITAAKPYIGKTTFCVDNVSMTGTAESMARYVAAMDIDDLGCYEVNPRRTNWQRQQGIYPTTEKRFEYVYRRKIAIGFWIR
jgi:hypothetical protein